MKYKWTPYFLWTAILSLAAMISFQASAASSKDWRDLIAKDSSRWRVESYEEGDLNADGRDDIVAVVSHSTGSGEKKLVWIFLRKKDGGYKSHTKTENWPGTPSLHPVGTLWTEDPEGSLGDTFKWQLDPGRDKFYLIEKTTADEKRVNYQTRKMLRRDPGESLVVCRVDPKKSQVALNRFNASAHPADPSLANTCADPTLSLDGEDAALLQH